MGRMQQTGLPGSDIFFHFGELRGNLGLVIPTSCFFSSQMANFLCVENVNANVAFPPQRVIFFLLFLSPSSSYVMVGVTILYVEGKMLFDYEMIQESSKLIYDNFTLFEDRTSA